MDDSRERQREWRRLLQSPVSGSHPKRRLDRGGNRQINTAIHRVAVTRARCHPETRAYLARKRSEGKTTTEAIRCLKRHLPGASGTYSSTPPARSRTCPPINFLT